MMNRHRYPQRWEELAYACKERAGWKCEFCGVEQFTLRTSRRGTPYVVYLHAAHRNHDQGNPSPQLLCLCITCYSRYDHEHRQREARVRLEQMKHLKRLIALGIVEIACSFL